LRALAAFVVFLRGEVWDFFSPDFRPAAARVFPALVRRAAAPDRVVVRFPEGALPREELVRRAGLRLAITPFPFSNLDSLPISTLSSIAYRNQRTIGIANLRGAGPRHPSPATL
jgi:hypothetical protein